MVRVRDKGDSVLYIRGSFLQHKCTPIYIYCIGMLQNYTHNKNKNIFQHKHTHTQTAFCYYLQFLSSSSLKCDKISTIEQQQTANIKTKHTNNVENMLYTQVLLPIVGTVLKCLHSTCSSLLLVRQNSTNLRISICLPC